VGREPGLGGAADPPDLLRADHRDRLAEARAGLRLDLAEDEAAAASRDQVELVASRPDVRAQDPVAAERVVDGRAPLGGMAEAQVW
jgi:uncharacterized heparinase superfamily protein